MSGTTRASAPRRRFRLFRPLDRYVATEFTRIFVVTALGFPLLVFIIDLVDNLRKYTSRNIPANELALSYLYFIPDTMYKVLPAAVLFATVFSVGAFTRHSEITAAKASGMSFRRFVVPIMVLSVFTGVLALAIGEYAPSANVRRAELLRETCATGTGDANGTFVCNESTNTRYNFVFGVEEGRVLRATYLNVQLGTLQSVETEQRGDTLIPGQLTSAQDAQWTAERGWVLRDGWFHIYDGDEHGAQQAMVIGFDSLVDSRLVQTPTELRASDREPDQMTFMQLSRFIETLERAGADVSKLRVERMLKLAIPATCVLIALFGAPLATSTKRGGTAYGVAISLGTTVVILMLIQLTKAIGGSGVVSPEVAAWIPNMLVGSLAVILLARVRT